MKIEIINKMSSTVFVKNFKNIFEKTVFISVCIEKKRPFKNNKNSSKKKEVVKDSKEGVDG